MKGVCSEDNAVEALCEVGVLGVAGPLYGESDRPRDERVEEAYLGEGLDRGVRSLPLKGLARGEKVGTLVEADT